MTAESDETRSLLVVVLDTNPVWWGQNYFRDEQHITFTRSMDSIMAFANSHLMLNHNNRIAIIAAHTNKSCFLYPKPPKKTEGSEQDSFRMPVDGKYELLSKVNDDIINEVRSLILSDVNAELYTDSLMAGALSMALCYINRVNKNLGMREKQDARILVIKGSEDNPAQYMNLMNVVFTAQKQSIQIDACVLDNESGLLQQACDITGGIYLKIPQMAALLEYLIWVFLPNPKLRSILVLPPKSEVDYRAACFCHRNLIDVGYVCSVCLSVFCSFSPICSTCQTTFKILGPTKLLKKKKKLC